MLLLDSVLKVLQGLFTAWVEREGAMLAVGALLQGCELQLYEDPDYLMIFRHALLSRDNDP